jgi:hypothetical protein
MLNFFFGQDHQSSERGAVIRETFFDGGRLGTVYRRHVTPNDEGRPISRPALL